MTKPKPRPQAVDPSEPIDRATELRIIYDVLKGRLLEAKGSGAAAIGRELRIVALQLEQIEAQEVSKVDELASRRKTKAGPARPASRRRKSR